MNDSSLRRRIAAAACGAALALSPVPLSACDESDGQFACQGAGFCLEYYGPARYVSAIRDATDCAEMGHTETDTCPTADASSCTLPRNPGTNVGSTQNYYGLDAEDREAQAMICANFGGTFDYEP